MKKLLLGTSGMEASEIALGFWRLGEGTVANAKKLVSTALDLGINLFDHADIYDAGACEEMFGRAVGGSSSLRSKYLLQSKCGIVLRKKGNYFDFSRKHLVEAVAGSLKRLKTDYLDILLLHRPDALMEPEEVADAFNHLHATGKVRHFGVSNMRPGQIELLRRCVSQPLIINQMQFSLTNSSMIDPGLATNMEIDQSLDRDGGILDYCRLNKITIQAWSPFQYGVFEGVFLGNPKFKELNAAINQIAKARGVTDSAVALAWILRHPARIQTIAGTTKPERLKQLSKASEFELTRAEWYDLFRAAGNMVP
ncbi:MAG: aldo/keto reductase [Planctomycetes bacterium]|nr:aldo/keto reductase [Planctomycetota bacterium]